MQSPDSVRPGSSLELLLRTGVHCTQTGWWKPVERVPARFIAEGSLMPSFEGQAVTWVRRQPGLRHVVPCPSMPPEYGRLACPKSALLAARATLEAALEGRESRECP